MSKFSTDNWEYGVDEQRRNRSACDIQCLRFEVYCNNYTSRHHIYVLVLPCSRYQVFVVQHLSKLEVLNCVIVGPDSATVSTK